LLELFYYEFFHSIDDIITNQISKTLEKYDSYRNKIGDRNLSSEKIIKYKEIKINKEYNNFIPINVKDKYRTLYIILFQAIRLSALLHDIGHPPYSHITEFTLKDIWNELKSIQDKDKNKRQKEFIFIMEIYFIQKVIYGAE
jgi:HD superfamily phosphohydrolase